MTTKKRKKFKTAGELLDWLVPKLGSYTPEKATSVIEWFTQHCKCREHNLVNCPECTVKALEKQKEIDMQNDF